MPSKVFPSPGLAQLPKRQLAHTTPSMLVGKASSMQISLHQLEEIALVRAHRHRMTGSTFDSQTGRVELQFEDPNEEATRLVEAHRRGTAEINSLDYAESLKWAKDRVFQVRREAGRD